VAASPAVEGSGVYAGNYGGVFLKADWQKGEILWRYGDGKTPYFSSPAVAAGDVVFGGRDGLVHCLDSAAGSVRWTFRTAANVDSSPAICDDKVIFTAEDGRLYMLDLKNGDLLWSHPIGSAVTCPPAVAAPFIVTGSDDGHLYAFRAD
jgi:outer membrane protein assembly factor BamB